MCNIFFLQERVECEQEALIREEDPLEHDNDQYRVSSRNLSLDEKQEVKKLVEQLLIKALGKHSQLVLRYLEVPVRRNHMPVQHTAEASLR